MIPRATYRLQFHKDFTFYDAAAHAEYFARLGVSHIYASPILKARSGSEHGYDVVDPAEINPELGGEAAFRTMVETLRERGIGIIIDIVPNHMATGPDNAWWNDVLEKGQASAFASYFDIEWNAPGLEGKVLAPFLGSKVEDALDRGELTIVHDPRLGRICFAYFNQRFPLRGEDQAALAGRDLSALAREEIVRLLRRQHFALAEWREAASHINWRRFFDITDLVALRIDRPQVFEAIHAKIFSLYSECLVDGVRVDHVDGLSDPRAYCLELRRRLSESGPSRAGPPYIVVEKILADGESMPPDWGVDGTTGYDCMEDVSALLHEPDGANELGRFWSALSGRTADFDAEERQARREVLADAFAAQARSAARAFARAASVRAFAIGEDEIRTALDALLVRLRTYRTYATGMADGNPPGPFFDAAVRAACEEEPVLATGIRAIAAIVSSRAGDPAAVEAIRRFNQLAAPIAAKAVEDRAFYRYGRLLSRNDVGFDPRRHFLSPEEFHIRAAARAKDFPRALLATGTHDHKRGEDVRARLAALGARPGLWKQTAERWLEANARLRPPDIEAGDEYQLYQTLIGSWPYVTMQKAERNVFAGRVAGWCRKFLREAALRSSWAGPDSGYETRFAGYAEALVADGSFGAEMERLLAQIAPASIANSLVQVTLKCLLPGVPDFYQGSERWDLSMVDPDNRRAVDFRLRSRTGSKVLAPPGDVTAWFDGAGKQWLTMELLTIRKIHEPLVSRGDYRPSPVSGHRAENIIAFSRQYADERIVAVAMIRTASALQGGCNIVPPRDWWGDTKISLDDREYKLADFFAEGDAAPPDAHLLPSFGVALPVAVLKL